MSSPSSLRPLAFLLSVCVLLVTCTEAVCSASNQQQRLVASPTSLSFGSLQVGTSKTVTETLTNSSNSNLTISQAVTSTAGFSVSGLNPPLTLAAGQMYTFSIGFAPQSSGSISGTLSISYTPSNGTLNIPLSGTGTASGQLAVSPTTLSFGNVVVDASETLSGKLSASGSSVTVSSATLNSSEFTVAGISLPLTLAAGQSTAFSVKFTPQSSGTASGSLTFKSNSSTSTTSEALSGAGVTAPSHYVSLSWNASSTATGYNVYRGSNSGGPYSKINSALDASTSYIDSSVVAGQTYYYVTTSVNASGSESGNSNQVKAVIPSP
jgi:Abnormal spindle-like microcephaly-assoc'd, ASPM-SPD-2-Hydin